jgi:hypothetical protein
MNNNIFFKWGGELPFPPYPPMLLQPLHAYRDRLPILAIIGNWYFYTILLFFARLLQNYLLNNFIT